MNDILIQSLESNTQILEDFINKMNDEEINKQIKDFWTIQQHLKHLVQSQEVILIRLKQFIDEDHPMMKPFSPSNENINDSKTTQEIINEYKKIRKQQLNVIKNADTKVWEKIGKHPEYKKYTFEILIRHALLHDGFHMWRIEELWIKNEDLILGLESN